MYKAACLVMVSVPSILMGRLNLKMCKKCLGSIFFLHLLGDKPLREELKLYGGSNIYVLTVTSVLEKSVLLAAYFTLLYVIIGIKILGKYC